MEYELTSAASVEAVSIWSDKLLVVGDHALPGSQSPNEESLMVDPEILRFLSVALFRGTSVSDHRRRTS
jgi:hypothetical protein